MSESLSQLFSGAAPRSYSGLLRALSRFMTVAARSLPSQNMLEESLGWQYTLEAILWPRWVPTGESCCTS